jgi:hypothetical protein
MYKIIKWVFLLAVFCQCQQSHNPEQSDQQINSLIQVVDSLQHQLNDLNVSMVQKKNDSLKLYYNSSLKFSREDEDYKKYKLSENILEWYSNLHKDIINTKSHLNELKQELKDDNKDSLVLRKLEKEKKIIKNLEKRFSKEYLMFKKEMDKVFEER